MPDKFTLALEIAETHPETVARYLEDQSPTSASSFIDAVPDTLSTRILESMLPYHAAKCIDNLSVAAAAKYIAALESRFAASILRHVGEETRDAIIAAMPKRHATRVKILLNYSLSVVGAWVNPTIMALPLNCRVNEAKARILREGYPDYNRVYVINADQSLAGFVRMVHFLADDDNRLLADVMEPSPLPLPANMSIEAALDDKSWLSGDYLPVMDRKERLLGILRYADIRATTLKPVSRTPDDNMAGTFMNLAENCYLGLADVLNTSLAIDPARPTEEGR